MVPIGQIIGKEKEFRANAGIIFRECAVHLNIPWAMNDDVENGQNEGEEGG